MMLTNNAQEINSNLRQRLTRGEFFALGLAFGAVGVFVWLSPTISYSYYDFKIYLNTAHGNFSGFYYAYWLLPIFSALAKLPLNLSYILWCSLNILGIFFAARVFAGKAPLALLSFQMFYNLIYGGISGVVVGALALCYWGLLNRKWSVAGLGIALASAKYQIGITGSLILLLTAAISWKDRLRALIVPILVGVASLILYPGWPLHALNNILSGPPNTNGSIALWRWLGPWALLLWVPPVLLPLAPQRRLLALMATVALALPYFQQPDLLFLLVMPIGWIGLLGNLGYLLGVYGWVVLQLLAVLPLAVYMMVLLPTITSLIKTRVAFKKLDST